MNMKTKTLCYLAMIILCAFISHFFSELFSTPLMLIALAIFYPYFGLKNTIKIFTIWFSITGVLSYPSMATFPLIMKGTAGFTTVFPLSEASKERMLLFQNIPDAIIIAWGYIMRYVFDLFIMFSIYHTFKKLKLFNRIVIQ